MFFRYPGGKAGARAQQQIMNLLPARFTEYREPCLGGGGIFWALSAAQGHTRRWINDLDSALISVYQALRDRPDAFLALCRTILPHSAADPAMQTGGQKLNARLLAEFNHLLADTDADPALRFLFLNRHARLGRVMYQHPSRTTFAHNRGWDAIWDADLMQQAIRHLEGAHVTTGDFVSAFCNAGEDVLVYVDPPYFRPHAKHIAQRLYTHEFAPDDHDRLAVVAHKSKHRILLSYNDCPEVRTLYRDWHILTASWAYVGQAGDQKPHGRELLISNFETTQAPQKTQAIFGAQGGSSTSRAKAEAARENGRKGGRPRGTAQSAAARAKISQARRK